MIQEYDYTQEKLADILGKAKSTISEIMSLNRLPSSIKEEFGAPNSSRISY